MINVLSAAYAQIQQGSDSYKSAALALAIGLGAVYGIVMGGLDFSVPAMLVGAAVLAIANAVAVVALAYAWPSG